MSHDCVYKVGVRPVIRKDWHQVSALEGIVLVNLIEYWHQIKSNQIKIEELDELPSGKKIPAPLKQDTLAVKKIIKTGEPTKPYKKIMVSDEQNKFLIFPQDPYWKKHSVFQIAQKIEMIESGQGKQWLLTLNPDLDKEGQRIWAEYCMKNKEQQEHGNKILENNAK